MLHNAVCGHRCCIVQHAQYNLHYRILMGQMYFRVARPHYRLGATVCWTCCEDMLCNCDAGGDSQRDGSGSDVIANYLPCSARSASRSPGRDCSASTSGRAARSADTSPRAASNAGDPRVSMAPVLRACQLYAAVHACLAWPHVAGSPDNKPSVQLHSARTQHRFCNWNTAGYVCAVPYGVGEKGIEAAAEEPLAEGNLAASACCYKLWACQRG